MNARRGVKEFDRLLSLVTLIGWQNAAAARLRFCGPGLIFFRQLDQCPLAALVHNLARQLAQVLRLPSQDFR